MQTIVMIDQDGVVCDASYQSNCELGNVWSSLLKKNVLLFANSDTPRLRLERNFREMLGVTPTGVIAENGMVLMTPDKVVTHPQAATGVVSFRGEVVVALTSVADAVHVGDAPTWRRQQRRFESHQRTILLDGEREYSVSLYALVTDETGLPQIDDQWGRSVKQVVDQLTRPDNLGEAVYNPRYGIMIMGTKDAHKTRGYELLRTRHCGTYYMIGDSDSDIIQDPSVIICSVGNGSSRLKERADFIASDSYTRGLRQCLEWILERT